MTYLARSSMGGLFDFIGPTVPSDEVDCLNRANSSTQVAAIDAMVANLSSSWNPTGYYIPADVRKILDMLASAAEQAGAELSAAPLSTSDADGQKAQAFDDLLRKYKDRSKVYESALVDARSSGANVINAPGLKDWVISSMRAISDGFVVATVLQCRLTWTERILDAAYKVLSAIGAVVAGVFGVAYKIGMSTVHAAETAGDIVAFAIKYAPYAGLGLGAYMLYHLVKKKTPR